MKVFYDFHIHSALSPCADKDNSPYNIVNMAKLNGLNAIAVTDHNSAQNLRAAVYAGRKNGLLVVPGMELTTNEDIHILCLFREVEGAEEFEKTVRQGMLKVKNRPDIFGRQYIYGNSDNIIGEEEILLSSASEIPAYKAAQTVKAFGGIAIPAHINREANGITAILGGIDADMGFTAVEISGNGREYDKGFNKDYNIIRNSDAHNLYSINDAVNSIEVEKLTASEVLNTLEKKPGKSAF